MNKFIRYFNQNKREIILIIIIILFVFIFLHLINFSIRSKKNNNIEKNESISSQKNTTKYNGKINTNHIIKENSNTISAQKDTDCIIKFIEACNDGKVEEAYEMISDDCKTLVFPSLDYFKQLYYNNIFSTEKSYNIQGWSGSTYKVDYKENILNTGKIDNKSIQDFITVINVKNEYKLNINKFVKKTNLNNITSIDNINIEVTSKNTFMDYEIYSFKMKNNNNYEIFLDNLINTDTIYLTDENNNKYVSYSHELIKEQLKLNPYSSIEIEIKFTNGYNIDRTIKKVTFSNAILNKEKQETKKIEIKFK